MIKVDREIEGVQPEPIDAGGCGVPGPSGLILLEKIEGNNQRYCVCDVGICVPEPYDYSTLHPGEYAGSFEWDGRNWNGPSDTEVPKGGRFPPGQYSLTLKAVGNRRVAGEETRFEVVGVFVFDLVEE